MSLAMACFYSGRIKTNRGSPSVKAILSRFVSVCRLNYQKNNSGCLLHKYPHILMADKKYGTIFSFEEKHQ